MLKNMGRGRIKRMGGVGMPENMVVGSTGG